MYNRAMAVRLEASPPLTPLSVLGPYRDVDYRALPDEPRCELLYGRLLVTPAPTLRHAEVVARLAIEIGGYADRNGGRVAVSPVDVVLAEHSVVQPDVIWISPARNGIAGTRVEGAPDLVVEVLSPSTTGRDRGEKLRLYAEAGVPEYWLVDPEAATFEFLVLRDGRYEVHLPLDGRYRSAVHRDLALELEDFWRRLER